MVRPHRAPDVLPAAQAAVSARIAKRVADNPAMADGWSWTATGGAWTIQAEDVTVRIAPAAGAVALGDCTCTCLLQPKCVHILAVLTALPEAAPASALPSPAGERAPEAGPAPAAAPAINTAQRRIVEDATRVLTDLLGSGAAAAGLLTRTELSRVGFAARAEGLHRLGRVLTRVVRQLRLLDARHPSFSLSVLSADLTEALRCARALAATDPAPAWLGVARRAYADQGKLRVWGLCAEPVLAGSGHAGVVTWLIDAALRRWSVSDVRPRAAGQAIHTYDIAPPLTMLAHRALAREGLFIQGATASPEGRLGAGQDVQAVRAAGGAWGAPPLGALWDVPTPTQVSRALAELDEDAPAKLLFLRGVVRGAWRDALVLEAPDGPLLVRPGSLHPSLPWLDNLRLLARAPGLAVRLVGRVDPVRARSLIGIAAAPDPAEHADAAGSPDTPTLVLPPAWGDRVNLGLDRLTTAFLPVRAAEPVRLDLASPGPADPLPPLRRRLDRAVLGGTESLPGEARGLIEREAAQLRAGGLPSAAELLGHLADSALPPAGRARADTSRFAARWLAGQAYVQAADRARTTLGWGVGA